LIYETLRQKFLCLLKGRVEKQDPTGTKSGKIEEKERRLNDMVVNQVEIVMLDSLVHEDHP
jgi:hypothetical protein